MQQIQERRQWPNLRNASYIHKGIRYATNQRVEPGVTLVDTHSIRRGARNATKAKDKIFVYD